MRRKQSGGELQSLQLELPNSQTTGLLSLTSYKTTREERAKFNAMRTVRMWLCKYYKFVQQNGSLRIKYILQPAETRLQLLTVGQITRKFLSNRTNVVYLTESHGLYTHELWNRFPWTCRLLVDLSVFLTDRCLS